MDGKRYFWLRLKDDFFDSLRIKKLRKMAGGDTYTIIYLKMQLLAMKHDGIIVYQKLEDTIAKEIALDIDEDETNVEVTLNYLIHCGLVEMNGDDKLFIPYSIENTGSEQASAQRVRDYRERQKMLQCNTNVTQVKQNCNGEIEKEKKIDKEVDINIVEIVAYLNEKSGTNFRCSTKETQKLIHGRIKDGYTIEDFKKVIDCKVNEWKNDTKMQNFLTPSTLFAQSNFEKYLIQSGNKQPMQSTKSSFDTNDFYEAALKRTYED